MFLRPRLAVANWKLNGDLALVKSMSQALNQREGSAVEAVICPSYPYLAAMAVNAQGFSLGAQNMSAYDSGAYTGEVSGTMIKDCGAKYVIVGHSERRTLFSETDEVIADKFIAAIAQGLTPILCVGETEQQRTDDKTQAVIASQIEAVIGKAGIATFANAVIAYEPVWAIGTGKTATAEQAQAVHGFIRTLLANDDANISAALSILYGGSVNAGNSKSLFGQVDIDGGLVGGASLKVDEFLAICQALDIN
jgi:triosephosphate isomerase